MRKILTTASAVAAAAAVSFGIVNISGGGVQEAEATWGDTRACVTDRELSKIRIGMPKNKVHGITDGAGRRTYFSGGFPVWEDRDYLMCGYSWADAVEIEYVEGRVARIDAWSYRNERLGW